MTKIKSSTLTAKEFSTRTGIPVSTVTKMLRSGQITGKKSSGKWIIPQDQLYSKAVESIAPPSNIPDMTIVSSKKESQKPTYSVSEFSRKTYLTEFGIEKWLKIGKIKGHKDTKGIWKVDAESLDLPVLKHLLRNESK